MSEPAEEALDAVREAAGAVIASLKQLIEATERVIDDPSAFSHAVDSGRSIVESFVGGFVAQANPVHDADRTDQDPAPDTEEHGSES